MGSKNALTCIVVDDEPIARAVLLGLLEDAEDFQVIAACSAGEEAVTVLREEEVDVVFLDLRMPEVDGFEVLRRLGADHWPLIVFVTAHDDSAIAAFEIGAIDYLLKPFDDDRFSLALDRVRRRVSQREGARLSSEIQALVSGEVRAAPRPSGEPVSPPLTQGSLRRVPVRLGDRIVFVEVSAIRWIQAEDYYVRLHVEGGSHLLRESLTRLESVLDPALFVRVHRSAIVRIDCVREMRLKGPGGLRVVLDDGTQVPVSRSRRGQVQQALGLDGSG